MTGDETLSDEEREAMRLEYQSLRSEIEMAIQNQVRILGYGGTALSLIVGFGAIQNSLLVITTLPFLAFFFSVLWNVEQTRMMRAGDYISTIETRFNEEEFEKPVMLWETWLRFRASEQPERDIYEYHYRAQNMVLGVFMLIIASGIVAIWVWHPGAISDLAGGILTLIYATFLVITYYLLKQVVKHNPVEHSFNRFRRLEREKIQAQRNE